MPFKAQIVALLLALSFQGCSSLFFYPDQITYRTPEFYELAYDDLYFESTDSLSLHAWHIYPRPEAAASKGLIFVAHGNAQNLSSHFTSWVWLVEAGYELFIFDYRGFGKSQGSADIKGTIEDTQAALDYLETHYKGEYFACGQSLGGSLLLNVLYKRANSRIKALIIDSTFTGFADIANEKMAQGLLTWPFQWLPYLTLGHEYDAQQKLSQIDTPLLFVHGSLDRTVSPNNSWQLFERAARPKEFWLVKEAGHIQALENEKVREDFLDFLRKHRSHFNPAYSAMKIYE
ncbi:MAG: alpha/beta fold hydrolase [Campylobacterales bacterium]|nr:alpha/beta fold hydrolase [Campylobacterales bacterium]